ncbi:hypothetical protein QJS10_CPB17g02164 [Acorus calamus]|uniref:UBA domain-containing protein n=1 Tax=Acorus calamus TaxID=4465 RepID=A0AAV9CUA6_ACOCL|nr:hypothetical protein QJS10_CPB17g02164 [Acorus calamus]
MDSEGKNQPPPPPSEPSTPSSTAATASAKLKIAGAWSGILDVDLNRWTTTTLREEVAKRANCGPECIKLICSGKIIKDGEDGNTKTLFDWGLKGTSKVLATRVSPEQGKALRDESLAEAERAKRLARIRAAATSLSKRHADGTLPIEDFNIEMEDQSGNKVELGSEANQQGVMMGLMLHANGKRLIKKQKYKDALDVLEMGEEAFSLCDPKVIEMVDNVPILQIDIVWCYFMLRDISWLSMAGVRLAKAREGFERSHGKDATRVRLLQAGRSPELPINDFDSQTHVGNMLNRYLRLDLLEGVVAYHSGLYDQSRKALTSAKVKYQQLQVSDESLSLLMSMGYKERAARKALRITNQDVESAVNFLIEEKEKKILRNQDDIRRRNEIMEQRTYGMTPLKKPVNLEKLNELVSIGFEKTLAAEALRRNENDFQIALDSLTNPETNSTLQSYLESKKRKRERLGSQIFSAVEMQSLEGMGFDRARVEDAMRSFSTREEILNSLTLSDSDIFNANNGVGPSNVTQESGDDMGNSHGPDTEIGGGIDVEMESEIAHDLNGDPLEDYIFEFTIEGDAITEYMTLLDTI